MNFFGNENLDILLEIHNEPGQIERQGKISQFNVKQKYSKPMIDYELKTMRTTKGNDDSEYDVSLEGCTCKDFIFNLKCQKPCKHMYRLAKELGLYSKIDERSKNLIADFSKGYADGWKFIVRPCNYSDLDICYDNILVEGESRGKNSQKDLILTQGKRYDFKKGEIFFDNIFAYDEIWENSLKKLNFCLQIDSVTETFTIPEVIFENEKFISQFTPIYGTVDFSVYRTNGQKTELEKIHEYSCRQDEFVELLKTGEFADLNGAFHKIC